MHGIPRSFYSLCNPVRVFFYFYFGLGKAAKKLLVILLQKISKASFAISSVFMEVQSLVAKKDLKVSVFFLL